jgi:hypothetical protein
MSKISIGEKEYDVKLNRMFIQPHLIINDITTDVGIWDNTEVDEQNKLLLKAAKCYEYNKKNNTLKHNISHIHNSEKIEKMTVLKPKTKKWWRFWNCL